MIKTCHSFGINNPMRYVGRKRITLSWKKVLAELGLSPEHQSTQNWEQNQHRAST